MRASHLWLASLALLLLLSPTFCAAAPGNDEYDSDDVPTPQAASRRADDNIPVTVKRVENIDAADEYDEDEFIVAKKPEPPKIKVIGAPETEVKVNPAPTVLAGPRTYYMEGFFVVIIIIYGINYLIGRKANSAIASKWAYAHRELLAANFSKVGDAAILIRQSVHRFRLKATGRRYVRGLQAVIELVRRHDAAWLLLRLFNVASEPDTITIDVPLRDQAMDSFVFAIVKRKLDSDFKKDNPDVVEYTSSGSGGFDVPASFVVYSEHAEILQSLFSGNLSTILGLYENDIQTIYVTDQCSMGNYKKILRVVYRIQPRDLERSVELFKFVLSFIDLVGETRLSKLAEERAEKRRRKRLEMEDKKNHAARQEALQKKKMEEYAKMTPEEKARRDEKEQRKAQKRRMKYKVHLA